MGLVFVSDDDDACVFVAETFLVGVSDRDIGVFGAQAVEDFFEHAPVGAFERIGLFPIALPVVTQPITPCDRG